MGQVLAQLGALLPPFAGAPRTSLESVRALLTSFETRQLSDRVTRAHGLAAVARRGSVAGAGAEAGADFGFILHARLYHEIFDPLFGKAEDHFRYWDPRGAGHVHALQVFGALGVCCRARLADKAAFLYTLFDFDESDTLTLSELATMLKVCVLGLAKISGCADRVLQLPADWPMRRAQHVMRAADSEEHDQRLSLSEWLAWVASAAEPVFVLTRHGTTDSVAAKRALLAARVTARGARRRWLQRGQGGGTGAAGARKRREQLRRERAVEAAELRSQSPSPQQSQSQPQSKSQQPPQQSHSQPQQPAASSPTDDGAKRRSRSGGLAGGAAAEATVAAAAAAAAAAGFAAGDPEHMSRSQRLSELRLLAKYKPALVRRLKRLFDALDTECTGSVETLELNAELRLLELPVQVTLNFSQRAHTSFAQLLEAVFPHSTPSEREEITRWVCRRPVTRELVAKIKQLFDALDTTFCGHVRLSRIVPLLARSQHLAEFVSVAPVRSAELFRSVTLPQLLERLFAHSHHHQLAEIRRWGAPSATLSGEQLHELEELFMHYDRDNSGTITMGELRLAFQAMGFAEETYRDLFRLYDTNGDKEINLFEFQAFYREVWGARDALAAAAAPPQTLEQLPQLQQLDTP